MQISAMIIDDEPLAREGLAMRLNEQPDFEVVAKCADGQEALEMMPSMQPNVLFVDIEMPRLNGMELAEILTTSAKQNDNDELSQSSVNQSGTSQSAIKVLPKIVFVTAFKDFAINAFDYQAFDYLLKPFSDERLSTCLNNLRQVIKEDQTLTLHGQLDHLITNKTSNSVEGFIHQLNASNYTGLSELQKTISVKSGNEWLRIHLDNLLWIEAAGDYMCVHTSQGTHIIRKTLNQFELELNAKQFPRISRSTIVNLSKVQKLTPNSNGEYLATLSSGDEVKVTRNYKGNLIELRK